MERTKLRMPLQMSGEVSRSKTPLSQLRRIATRLFVGRFSRTWCRQHRIVAVFPSDLAKAMFLRLPARLFYLVGQTMYPELGGSNYVL